MRKKILGPLVILLIMAAGEIIAAGQSKPRAITTNKNKLLTLAVQGQIAPAQPARSYTATWDGRPKLAIGIGGINYNLKIGDKVFGWANGDRATVGVAAEGIGEDRFSSAWLTYTCIGNKAEVISGEAARTKGFYIGRHAGSDDLIWFPQNAVEKLALNDKIQVKARGVGLKIEGFEDVRVNKLSPELLEKMGITIERGQLVVPVVMEIPGHIMGSGLGFPFIEALDYDVQTTCPEIVEEYGLEKLRLGDLVAIKGHYDVYAPGRYEGAVTIGVVIHGFSDLAGHGPGMNPVLSALPGKIKTRLDPNANTAHYLGIRAK